MTEKIIILVLCLFIFSLFGALAYIALDTYVADYSLRSNGIGKLITGAVKWISNTIGDKVTAGAFLVMGVGAVAYFLMRIRKEAKAKT